MDQCKPDGQQQPLSGATDDLADVMEVISLVDPAFRNNSINVASNPPNPPLASPILPPVIMASPNRAVTSNTTSTARPDALRISVAFREQSDPAGVRYRYESEVRASYLQGASSTETHKTFPTIQLVGADADSVLDFVVVVSCVTASPPYRPHPHKVIGDSSCSSGFCNKSFAGTTVACFKMLGIQCVKKRDIEQSLATRKAKNIDPFRTGFGSGQPYEMKTVRLCFQVFVRTARQPNQHVPLEPVVTDPVRDKRTSDSLVINTLSHAAGSVRGGLSMILLCERVKKDEIAVQFVETGDDGEIVWSAFAEFGESEVHKQVAISFRTPRYRDVDTANNVPCGVRLYNQRTMAVSEVRPFEYYAEPSGDLKRKRVHQSSEYKETIRMLGAATNQPMLPPFNTISPSPANSPASPASSLRTAPHTVGSVTSRHQFAEPTLYPVTQVLNRVDLSSDDAQLLAWNRQLETLSVPPSVSADEFFELEGLPMGL